MNFETSFGTYNLHELAKWYDHPDGGQFLIAPLNNNKQMELTMKLTKLKEDYMNKTVYETKEVSSKILSQTVLIDWKEITDEKGKELKYSHKAAESVLLKYNSFTEWVLKQSTDLSKEIQEAKEEEVKNSVSI